MEHGYGHKELGARQHWLDGEPMALKPFVASGVNQNDIGFADPTRSIPGVWLDWVTGASVRQGIPATIRKVV